MTVTDIEPCTVQTAQEFALQHGFTEPMHVTLFSQRYGQHMAEIGAWRLRYEADVRDWYTDGDGARRGYGYPCCIHGTSRWTDYDNICGPCEDGYTDEELAVGRAKDDVEVYLKRAKAWMEFRMAVGFNAMGPDLAQALLDFVMAPITEMPEDC